MPIPDPALRTGEVVTAAVIRSPDPIWADRVEGMLRHKGDPWNWQNSELLRREVGVEARFFILHRGGAPFANIMLAEAGGVGILGHVWTEPADRGGGASSILMNLLLEDFRKRGGRALFLGTEFDSAAWRYYKRRGFEPVEPGSDYMELYRQPAGEFFGSWFEAADAVVEPLDWRHWPASVPLFLGPWPGAVRIAATQLFGRRSSEGRILGILREERRRRAAGEPGCARVLRASGGAAVLGFASWQPDPEREGKLVDLYCHPGWWHRADDLLAALPLRQGDRLKAYADAGLEAKAGALERAGFRQAAILPQWVASDAAGRVRADVAVFVRE
jgi:GNAT superfamily N-acetyltransferase